MAREVLNFQNFLYVLLILNVLILIVYSNSSISTLHVKREMKDVIQKSALYCPLSVPLELYILVLNHVNIFWSTKISSLWPSLSNLVSFYSLFFEWKGPIAIIFTKRNQKATIFCMELKTTGALFWINKKHLYRAF